MADRLVLIVGAGPTGLVLALWLTKAGIPVRIIDQTSAPGTTSRAVVFHARNLEFYRQLGIDRITTQHGFEAKAGNLWLRGKQVGRLPFGNLGRAISAYPYALIIPQDVHEKLLVEQLESFGVCVERDTELVDFTSSDDGVTAELCKHGGNRETCRAAYLAGCDGASSTVREKLGIGFPGGTYADVYYVADIQGTGPVINGQLHIALDDADFLAIFPMQGAGRARLIGAVHSELQRSGDLKWDDVSHEIIRRLQMNVEEVKWFSTYRVHHRVASHFQKQRAFLLGDAAHVHSPVGGQGMNTGIGDAVNLAWKLAAVLSGDSPPSLLETYEPERIAFARRLVATTDRVFAFVSSRGPLATQVRIRVVPRLLPLLFSIAAVRRFLFRTVSQVAIRYPQSALSRGLEGTTQGGDRLPWVQFNDSNGQATDNFANLASRQWQVHRYGDQAPALQATCDARELALHVFPWNDAAQAAGLRKNAAYVVRPDGYIGIAIARPDTVRLAAYLDTWLIRGNLPTGGSQNATAPAAD